MELKKKVLAIIGARPQFIKHFPFEMAAKDKLNLITVHTGQHYDANMSNIFFEQLGMSEPDFMLNVGSGKHGEQTAKMMLEVEKICLELQPDAVMVYGDTNSTIAGALVASKLHIPIVHVEAGLRSFNKKMPEEVNRILTDHISELMFVPSDISVNNLKNEGIEKGVYVVGDIMKDMTHYVVHNELAVPPPIKEPFAYITLHRPYNVDGKERLTAILNELNKLRIKCVFPIHPRTRHKMKTFGMDEAAFPNIQFIDPQGYLDNLGYLNQSEVLITDSGGMQKEAYWLEKRCLTIRSETEWLETLTNHANQLIFEDLGQIEDALNKKGLKWDDRLYGDGKSAVKMVETIAAYLN